MSRILDLLRNFNLPDLHPDWATAAGPDVVEFLRPSPDVAEHRNVPYRGDSPHDRHALDVYAPAGKAGFPVLVFVHGGSWVFGTKDWYAPVGRSLAKAGIGCVLPNYRLLPWVRHPAHAEDVAAAVAWTARHAAGYGGDPDRLFLGGHSAGGHLAALVALNGQVAVPVRGVIGVSGVYRLSPRHPGFPFVFGTASGVADAASPVTHVRPGCPPVVAVYAADDYPTFDRMAEEMAAAVRRAGGAGEAVRVDGVNHVTVIVDAADPRGRTHAVIRRFVVEHGGPIAATPGVTSPSGPGSGGCRPRSRPTRRRRPAPPPC